MIGYIRRIMVLLLVFLVLCGFQYSVKDGDTLTSVADQFHVTTKRLRAVNPGVSQLQSGMSLVIPDGPPEPPKWNPTKPLDPPLPTVSQLQRAIEDGSVKLTENSDYPGYYFMWAGPNQDEEFGQIRPSGSGGPGKGGRVKGNGYGSYDFYAFKSVGGGFSVKSVGRSSNFKRPESVEACGCVP